MIIINNMIHQGEDTLIFEQFLLILRDQSGQFVRGF